VTSIFQTVQSLDLEAPIDLFRIWDTGIPSTYFTNISGVVFAGISYQPIPCKFEWLNLTSEGAVPGSSLVASDVKGILGGLVEAYGGLLGAKLEATQTWRLFLDGQPGQDATQFRGPVKLRINQRTWEPMNQIEFQCVSGFDLERLTLPNRAYLKRCQWLLGDENCRAPGHISYDLAGNPTSDPTQRACGKDLASCRRYHGHVRHFGGFVGIQRYN